METREQLKVIARMMTGLMAIQGIDVIYEQQNVARDLGAETYHDTIIAYTPTGSFQIFSPRDIEEIKDETFPVSKLVELVEKHKESYK